MKRLVVVGASLAGLRAVEAARRSGFTGDVTMIGAEPHLPYTRPPLSKAVLGEDGDVDVEFRTEAHLTGELGVELLLGSPAEALDTATRSIVVDGREVTYDALVIATGSNARRLPGSDGTAGIHTLRSLDDALAVRAALDAGARTVVIGCGFIGSEVASAARRRGLPVTIVEAADTPLERAVGPAIGPALAGMHRRSGTRLLCGIGVDRIESTDGQITAVRLTDGRSLDADLVVAGIGADPATGWLHDSGLDLHDGIGCDETLAARGAEDVDAAGDVAHWHNRLFDRTMRIEHWTTAAEQGAAAGRNAVAAPAAGKVFETVPYFWSDWYGHRIQFVGIPGGDLEIVDGHPDDDHVVALYRDRDRVQGALTLNGQSVVMKYRGLIARRGSWLEALELARSTRRTVPSTSS